MHLCSRYIAEHQKISKVQGQHTEVMVYFYFFLYYPLCFNLIQTRLKVITKFKKVPLNMATLGIYRCSQVHTQQQIQVQSQSHCS